MYTQITRWFLIVAVACFGFTSIAMAQGGGGGNTGGGTGGGNTGGNTGGFNTGGSTFGNNTTGSTTGSTFSTGNTTTGSTTNSSTGTSGRTSSTNSNQPLNLGQNELNLAPTDPQITDSRNQGFIGPTAAQIREQGFVGAATELSGGQPVEGSTFGGGVNSSGGGQAAGQARPGGGASNAQGLRATGGMPGLNTGGINGMNAGRSNNVGVRRSVRNRLVNKVDVTRTPAIEVSQRFQTRLDRIPGTVGAGNGVQIALNQGVATLTGQVATKELGTKIERQLRLEPGVYKIDNQLTVGQ